MSKSAALAGITILILVSGGWALVSAAEATPTICYQEIERVCLHLEDRLENCLSERGAQLSAPCRDQLISAMNFMQSPSGPAPCVADVQRICPDLKSNALAQCIQVSQARFSPACQQFIQGARQAKTEAAP